MGGAEETWAQEEPRDSLSPLHLRPRKETPEREIGFGSGSIDGLAPEGVGCGEARRPPVRLPGPPPRIFPPTLG